MARFGVVVVVDVGGGFGVGVGVGVGSKPSSMATDAKLWSALNIGDASVCQLPDPARTSTVARMLLFASRPPYTYT